MKKSEETVKAMITEEQLKLLQEQQGKLNEMLRTVGVLEVQKSNVSKEIDWTNSKLCDIILYFSLLPQYTFIQTTHALVIFQFSHMLPRPGITTTRRVQHILHQRQQIQSI